MNEEATQQRHGPPSVGRQKTWLSRTTHSEGGLMTRRAAWSGVVCEDRRGDAQLMIIFTSLLIVGIISVGFLCWIMPDLPLYGFARIPEVQIASMIIRAGPNPSSLPPKSVVFYLDGIDEEVERMKAGSAGGEIRLFTSLVESASNITNVESRVISLKKETTRQELLLADFIFTDQYRLQSLLSLVPEAVTNPAISCKLRFVDFWGTPPEQNHLLLDPRQFLVPYPNPWNDFIGFRQELIGSTIRRDRPTAVLHGKLGRYFKDHLHVIHALTKEYNVFATVPPSQMGGIQFPDAVLNMGICSRSEWENLLSKASFVISFGDPVLAPTALEALAAGSPYIFAKYAQPRALSDLPAHPIESQHDFLMKIGPPFAYAIHIDSVETVLQTANFAVKNVIQPWIPRGFRPDDHIQRLKEILKADLCINK